MDVSGTLASRLRRVQVALSVHPDGILGPETLSALESRLGIAPPRKTTSLECSRSSLEVIVELEVTSKAVYEKKYRRPTWPGGRSGVTIGIGYDLGVTDKAEIEADWSGRVSDVDLAALLAVQGVTGAAAKKLARSVARVEIPFGVAAVVFYQLTLPRFARSTRRTYPGVQRLPADAQGMMLSLIYNRGTSLAGERRTEMADIKKIIRDGGDDCLERIAGRLDAMQRLWPNLPGLRARRAREAEIIRASDRDYDPDELVRL